MSTLDDEIRLPADAALAEAAAKMMPYAVRVASRALEMTVPGYRQQLQRAIDRDQAALTVQIDLPSGAIHVLIDGEDWLGPECLLTVQPRSRLGVKGHA